MYVAAFSFGRNLMSMRQFDRVASRQVPVLDGMVTVLLTRNIQERDESTGELKWYSKAKGYWENVAPTVNGVLGGYSYVSNIDAKGSQTFLMPLLKSQPKPWVALGMSHLGM